jgi:putative hydrolase
MTRRLVAAVSRQAHVLGHVTGRLVRGERGTRPPSTFDARAVFAACAAHDVAVEINARPEREDPPSGLIALALAEGACSPRLRCARARSTRSDR